MAIDSLRVFHGQGCFTHRRSRHAGTGRVLEIDPGQPYWEGIASWPDGRFEYRYFGRHHLLQLCLAKLSERDIAAFSEGQVHVGFYVRQAVLFILFKIENLMDWSDQAFSIQLVGSEDRELPPHIAGTHQALSLVLVEAETGLVRGLRIVTYSNTPAPCCTGSCSNNWRRRSMRTGMLPWSPRFTDSIRTPGGWPKRPS